MQTTQPTFRLHEPRAPLWFGGNAGWGEAVRTVDPSTAQSAEAMIAAAGLGWSIEQHPLEAVVERGAQTLRLRVAKHVANVRSDSGTVVGVVGVVGEGYEPLQNRAAFAFCDAITDSGRAHWIGAGETRGGAGVHALMRLDREIRIGGAEGEEVLPLLCFRNGHDAGLAVTVSVAPFRLACLNGMLLPLPGALAGESLDALRRQDWQRLRKEDPRRAVWLKGTRFVLRQRAETLSPGQRSLIEELAQTNERVYRGWLALRPAASGLRRRRARAGGAAARPVARRPAGACSSPSSSSRTRSASTARRSSTRFASASPTPAWKA